VVRRLPEDPDKRRLQVFKRVYQHLEHFRALAEDRGMDMVVPDPATGEDIAVNDLLVGLESLPGQQRKAFELICLQGYTETAARDVLLPNSKSSTPVQQYADSGLIRMVDAYDLNQQGQWPPVEKPKPIKKTKRRSIIMAALHPIVRQGLEATRNKLLKELEALKASLSWVEEQLGVTESAPASAPALQAVGNPPPGNPQGKPDLHATAKEMAAAAINE
jgi:hypothetical protein